MHWSTLRASAPCWQGKTSFRFVKILPRSPNVESDRMMACRQTKAEIRHTCTTFVSWRILRGTSGVVTFWAWYHGLNDSRVLRTLSRLLTRAEVTTSTRQRTATLSLDRAKTTVNSCVVLWMGVGRLAIPGALRYPARIYMSRQGKMAMGSMHYESGKKAVIEEVAW